MKGETHFVCVCVHECVRGVFPLITSEDNRQTTLAWLQSALTYRQCEGGRQSNPSGRIQIDTDDKKKYQKGKSTKYSCKQKENAEMFIKASDR